VCAQPADHVDASLRNSWGIAFNPNGAVWVADNKINTATLYDGAGIKVSLGSFPEVHLPPGTNGAAAPTGIGFNSSSDFARAGSSTVCTASVTGLRPARLRRWLCFSGPMRHRMSTVRPLPSTAACRRRFRLSCIVIEGTAHAGHCRRQSTRPHFVSKLCWGAGVS
jgi:hypothetical protein